MKVLLDHNVSRKLRRYLPGHTVQCAKELNVHAIPDPDLLRFAEANGFQVLVTSDQNIYHQQNNKLRRVSLVELSTNRWRLVEGAANQIAAAVGASTPGSYRRIEIPLPVRNPREPA